MISFSRSFCHFPVQLVPACKLFKELVTGSCLEDFLCVFVCADITIKKKKKTFRQFGEEENETCEKKKNSHQKKIHHSPLRSLKGTRFAKVANFEGLLLSNN